MTEKGISREMEIHGNIQIPSFCPAFPTIPFMYGLIPLNQRNHWMNPGST